MSREVYKFCSQSVHVCVTLRSQPVVDMAEVAGAISRAKAAGKVLAVQLIGDEPRQAWDANEVRSLRCRVICSRVSEKCRSLMSTGLRLSTTLPSSALWCGCVSRWVLQACEIIFLAVIDPRAKTLLSFLPRCASDAMYVPREVERANCNVTHNLHTFLLLIR